jgi:hypothetical protein
MSVLHFTLFFVVFHNMNTYIFIFIRLVKSKEQDKDMVNADNRKYSSASS